jgi:PAS domain S-box-containing protein
MASNKFLLYRNNYSMVYMSNNLNYTKKEDLYSKIYSSMNEGVAIHRIIFNGSKIPVNYEIIDVNPAFEEILGIEKGEVLGKNIADIYGTVKPTYIDTYDTVSKTGIPNHFESYFEAIDKYFGINVFSPSEGMLVTIFEDITERRKNQEELIENKRTLETLISNLPGVAYKCQNDAQWTMEFVSKGCFQLTGYKTEDLINNKKISYNDLIHPDDRQMVWDTIQTSLKDNKPFKIIYRIITSDLEMKYVWEQGRGIFSSDNKLLALEGFITDITPRIKSEEEVKKSEAYYRTIFENTGTATIIIEDNTTISLANSEFEKLSGYSKEELEGRKSWIDLLVEDEIETVMDYHKSRRIKKSTPKNYEIKLVNKGNEIRDVYVTVALLPYTQKRLISFMDITDKKESRKALIDSQKKYKELAELLPQPIFESNLKKDVTFTNQIGFKMFGYTQEDLDTGLNMLQLLDPKDHDKARENVKRSITMEELFVEEYTGLKKDGTNFPILVYSNSLKHDDKVVGSRGVIVDLTDIKNVENNLKASIHEKEILLREIHHRVKNNMQIISSLLNLQTEYVDDEEAVNVLKESQNRVKSMAIIHENLYKSNDLAHINFVDYINSLVLNLFYSYNIDQKQIKPLLKIEDINLNIETAVPCGLIISELISNSLKYAFPNKMKGEIIISLKSVEDTYHLCICDNGIGLPEDINFSNIKTLGLLLVNSLTEQIDGEITIKRGHGTKFKIIFKEQEYKERI